MVTPSTMSPYFSRPATSVMIGIEYGSHSARSVFGPTFWPSRTSIFAP